MRRRSRLTIAAAALALSGASACGSDPHVAFARLLERAASWSSSVEFAAELQVAGQVPRAYLDDLTAKAAVELTALTSEIASADGVDAESRRKAAANCNLLAASLTKASRPGATLNLAALHDIEVDLRDQAQRTREQATQVGQ